jgi:hypothetical protein
MNAGYISAFAALAGSLIGGLTTFAAAWVTQRQQANVQWLLQEKTRRQELYQQFIEEASKLYVDALIHDQAEIPPLVSLYALINKMRVLSHPGIAERADKVVRIIVDTYALPNKSFQEVRAMMERRRAGPFARLQRGLPRRTFSSLFPSLTIRISSRVNRSLRSRVCADRSPLSVAEE